MKNKYLIKLLFALALAIPILIVFRSIFFGGNLAWGDAPHFYQEGLKELFSEPQAWTERGNALGGPNILLWVSPLMILYGALNTIFHISNGLIVRLIFYAPSIILAAIGALALAREEKLGRRAQFFTSLIYVFNTYFLLLIDGGQVGIALAYGMFPVTLLFFKRLLKRCTLRSFIEALVATTLLGIFDPRILIICYLSFFVWQILAGKKLFLTILLLFANLSLFMYFVLPLMASGINALPQTSGLNLYSLLNSLTLFQPNWPGNIFGQVSPPPYYFIVTPFLVFVLFLRNKVDKKVIVLGLGFLFFAFLAKGRTYPLGEVYGFLINKIPFGVAFRDSSKFLVPTVLFAGMLFGLSIEKFKNKWVTALAYIFIIFLVKEAFLGQMNFVLSGRLPEGDLSIIHQELSSDDSSFRTAWFPEVHPLSFETKEKPAISAKELANFRPLARINAGTFDKFNYFNNSNYLDWYRLFGIKYLIFSGDSRVSNVTEEEKKNFDTLLGLAAAEPQIEKQNWGDIPAYKVEGILPNVFSVPKLVVVVGGDSIYDRLRVEDKNFKVENQGFVFLEDGKFDPKVLDNVDSSSLLLTFNDKAKTDLAMTYLSAFFKAPVPGKSGWSVYSTNDYPLYKYQLLIRNYNFEDFDYGLGISFSEKKGENLIFNLDANTDGEYILAVRGSGEFNIEINGTNDNFELSGKNLSWFTKQVYLKKGNYNLVITNNSSLGIVNTASLIPLSSYQSAQTSASSIEKRVKEVDIKSLSSELSNLKWTPVEVSNIRAGDMEISTSKGPGWIMFTDTYNKDWSLKRDQLSYDALPAYSAINVFYKRPDWQDFEIVYEGQRKFRMGIYFSLLAVLGLGIIFLVLDIRDKK